MGNFLFRTGSYRRAKAIEGQQKKTNELLTQIAAQNAPAPPGVVSADGHWVWDGRQWQPRA